MGWGWCVEVSRRGLSEKGQLNDTLGTERAAQVGKGEQRPRGRCRDLGSSGDSEMGGMRGSRGPDASVAVAGHEGPAGFSQS